jgi:hypothetical protein
VMPGDALIAQSDADRYRGGHRECASRGHLAMVLQIGTRRDGLYGYDRLDRLFGFLDRPSATRILPEFQHLAVGDKIPWGRDELTVSVLEPLRALALSMDAHGMEWVWQFGLDFPRHGAFPENTALVDGHAHHGARGVHHDPPLPARRQRAIRSAASVGLLKGLPFRRHRPVGRLRLKMRRVQKPTTSSNPRIVWDQPS